MNDTKSDQPDQTQDGVEQQTSAKPWLIVVLIIFLFGVVGRFNADTEAGLQIERSETARVIFECQFLERVRPTKSALLVLDAGDIPNGNKYLCTELRTEGEQHASRRG